VTSEPRQSLFTDVPTTPRAALCDTRWQLSWRADPVANVVAKRHYNSQSPDSAQWVKPGACLCFRTAEGGAIWSSSAPFAQYVQHAWAGAWENSTFRNERRDLYLSSDLITEAVAITRWVWKTVPPLGMITMVDASKTRRKRDPGRCYRRAGFRHVGFTQGGLWVFQMLEDEMPEPLALWETEGACA
jgi:hypothetical protein